jgi:di/tricarboxylate transporter
MTVPIAITLAIITAAVILFATEKLRVDVIALLVLLATILFGLVTPAQGFSGFSSPAVITVWAVYIVSAGLFKTGVADTIGDYLLRLTGRSEPRLIAAVMLACGLMSGFMNNIGATAVLLPAVMSISRQTKTPASRLLIPLSFASLLGGNMTLIGTPPNVLAASILAERGLPTFQFFDFAPTGMLVFGLGIAYMVLLGRHLLPVRLPAEEQSAHQIRAYLSEVRVRPDSRLVGKTLTESRLGADYDLTVVGLARDGKSRATFTRDTRFMTGDVLVVEGTAENLLRARDKLGLDAEAEREVAVGALEPDNVSLIEATLAPRSPIVGRSLKQIRFRDRYRFTALAIWRQGAVITQRLSDVPLRFGDTLLLQGPRDRLPALQAGGEFLILEPVRVERPRRRKALLSLGILGLVLFLVVGANFAISTAMVIGAVLMVLTGCLTMDEAYQSIAWRSVFLIAGMLPLGLAMENTGTARYLADQILSAIGGLGPIAILAGIYLLGSLITEPMSNAAATVLIVPISIDIALGLGADPRPFVLATVIATSTSFLTPVGHQANLLVMGPGGYKFTDYTRVGFLLNVLIMLATMLILPLIWPLFP